MSWFERLKKGLGKTSGSIASKMTHIFIDKRLDEHTLEALEELLITSDMGTRVASNIIAELKKDKFQKDITDEEVKTYLADKIAKILTPCARELQFHHRPQVILMCGVNGSGKTTTIGKIAGKLHNNGKKVMLAACDTFRAAADLQLKVWAERIDCKIIHGEVGADAASVAYQALEKSIKEEIDVLLIDTAGRLNNKKNLMDELAKINRVLKKLDPEAPHDVILVLDAGVGQNALAQVETFKEVANVTGLIITKLDGTAKAGIIVAIAQKFALPVYLIGVGEKMEDLDEFDPTLFSKSLFGL